MQNVTAWMKVAPGFLGRAAGNLFHPLLIRVPGYAGDADAPALQMNEEQNVVGDESSQGEQFHGKEVSTRQNVFIGGDKVLL